MTFKSQKKHGIQWIPWMQLDDLDFADDLVLLSHTTTNLDEYGVAGFFGNKLKHLQSKSK